MLLGPGCGHKDRSMRKYCMAVAEKPKTSDG